MSDYSNSIEQLRVYKSARDVEDIIYDEVKALPAEHFYGIGNDLRRSSAAVSHYLMEAHRLFSYRLKLDSLAAARREAEACQRQIESAVAKDLGIHQDLIEKYTEIIKQTWAHTKWVKNKLDERRDQAEAAAKEQMLAEQARVQAVDAI